MMPWRGFAVFKRMPSSGNFDLECRSTSLFCGTLKDIPHINTLIHLIQWAIESILSIHVLAIFTGFIFGSSAARRG